MSHSSDTDSHLASATLSRLHEAILSPDDIELGYRNKFFTEHDLVMTSMGNRHRAVITPMYPGLPYEHSLLDRLDAAALYSRPLIEANLRLNKRIATATFRLCQLPRTEEPAIFESSWSFDLGVAVHHVSTMDDVVEQVIQLSNEGLPAPERTGLVFLSAERRVTNNWGISERIDASEAAHIIHTAVTQDLTFA